MCARGRRAPPSHLSSTSPGNVRCLEDPWQYRWIIAPHRRARGPDALSVEEKRIPAGVHDSRGPPVAPYRWGITPRGRLTGRGGASRPCLLTRLKTSLAENPSCLPSLAGGYGSPSPPGRSVAPPPPRGGGQVFGDSPGYSARREEQDFGRVFTLTAERTSPVAPYRWIITPVGEGGRRRLPPLLSLCVTVTLF